MSYRLRSYELTPPGGYVYEQTEGIYRKFPSVPMVEDQARSVSSFRKANGLPRPSVAEALRDIDRQTCARLGNSLAWCIPSDGQTVALNASNPIIAPPCQGCGAPVG